MTRDELIEAVCETTAIHPIVATAALSAIEAAGFAIVPVVASEGMVDAARAGLILDPSLAALWEKGARSSYRAMIQAAQEEMK